MYAVLDSNSYKIFNYFENIILYSLKRMKQKQWLCRLLFERASLLYTYSPGTWHRKGRQVILSIWV